MHVAADITCLYGLQMTVDRPYKQEHRNSHPAPKRRSLRTLSHIVTSLRTCRDLVYSIPEAP